MPPDDPSALACTAALGVSNLVGEQRASSVEVESFCRDLLVSSFIHRAPVEHLKRVVAELVAGGMRHEGTSRGEIAAGLVRGAIRGGCQIGLLPEEAAIIAVETAATHSSNSPDEEVTEAAVEAALHAMQSLGGEHVEGFVRWLGERRLLRPAS